MLKSSMNGVGCGTGREWGLVSYLRKLIFRATVRVVLRGFMVKLLHATQDEIKSFCLCSVLVERKAAYKDTEAAAVSGNVRDILYLVETVATLLL